jgi:hypothetical protein
MPALTLWQCALSARLFSQVNLLNIQQVVCANSNCVSASQARKRYGFLTWSYFVSGCDDMGA